MKSSSLNSIMKVSQSNNMADASENEVSSSVEKEQITLGNICFLDQKSLITQKTEKMTLGLNLLTASKSGQLSEILSCICKGAPFLSDTLGASPLHWAAYNCFSDIAELLLNSGIDCDLRNKVNRTPLHLAAQGGHASMIEMLLSYGAHASAIDFLEMTPLHWAVESGDLDSVKLLIDFGANKKNKFGKTPYDIAKKKGFSDICDLFKDCEAVSSFLQLPHVKRQGREINYSSKSSFCPTSNQRDGSVSSINPPPNNMNDVSTLNLLKQHGIQMIDTNEENACIVTSAIENGQQIVLTEAGKLALGSVSVNDQNKGEDGNISNQIGRGLKRAANSNSGYSSVAPGKMERSLNIGELKSNVVNSNGIKEVGVYLFEGNLYKKNEEGKLIQKLKTKIGRLRHESFLLHMHSKKKFREANNLQQQLVMFLKKTGRSLDDGIV